MNVIFFHTYSTIVNVISCVEKSISLDLKITIIFILIDGISDIVQAYYDEYCHCKKTADRGPWCDKWMGSDDDMCMLDGGEKAQFCPYAYRPFKGIADYLSTHPLICNKSKRMYRFINEYD